MRRLSIIFFGLFVVGCHEVFATCDEDGGGTCNAIEAMTKDLELKAVKKAHDILRALDYDASTAVYSEDDESVGDNDGRGGRFVPGFAAGALKNALAVLKIFDISFNKYAYVEKVEATTAPLITWPPASTTPPPPPPGCNCTMSNYEPCRGGEGVCSSAEQCQGMGGEQIGKCANCLGCSVCCKYMSGCQGMTDMMISYFQSPAYPRTDRSNEACSLTVNVRDEVCQVRLDLIDFEMAAPVCGDCSNVDNLEIINTAQPGGVIGPGQSRLCGLNSGQHLYLPVTPRNMLILKATTSGVRNVPLAAANGRNRGLSGDTAFRWNVRVTQIPCRASGGDGGVGEGIKTGSVEVAVGGGSVVVSGAVGFEGRNGACRCRIPKYYRELRAPPGCRQYFAESRGKLKSLNFDGQSEVSTGLGYSICIRRTNDACGMTLNALTFSLPASPYCLSGEETIDCYGGLVSEEAMEQAKAKMTVCCTGSWDKEEKEFRLPGVNFFGFAGFADGQAMQTMRGSAYDPNQNRYFYCGAGLGNGSIVVGRTKGPLTMRVETSGRYWGQCCPGGDCLEPPPTHYHQPPTPGYPGHGSRYRRSIEPQPAGYSPEVIYPPPPPLSKTYCPEGGCLGFLINYDVNRGSC